MGTHFSNLVMGWLLDLQGLKCGSSDFGHGPRCEGEISRAQRPSPRSWSAARLIPVTPELASRVRDRTKVVQRDRSLPPGQEVVDPLGEVHHD